MVMTDYDVEGLLQFAIRHTATKLGIQDTDWKTPKELLAEIAIVDYPTHELSGKFCDAYLEWYRYVKQLDQLGKHGNLDGQEQAQLFELEKKRNSTRSLIIGHLKKL
jgi:hypothetical protein